MLFSLKFIGFQAPLSYLVYSRDVEISRRHYYLAYLGGVLVKGATALSFEKGVVLEVW